VRYKIVNILEGGKMQTQCKCFRGAEFLHGIPHEFLLEARSAEWKKEILHLHYFPEMTGEEELNFLQSAYRAAQKYVSPEIRENLYKLTDPYENGALVISGVPCIVPSLDNEVSETELITPAVLFGLVMLAGGIPFGYWEEQNGRLLQNIKKIFGREFTKSSQGVIKLPFHTDGAWFKEIYRPNFLTLGGIENENEVATCLLHVEKDILKHIPSNLKKEVEKEQFTFGVGDAFIIKDVTAGVKNRSIIYYDKTGCPRIALPSSGFPQENDRKARIIRDFQQYLSTLPSRKISLKNERVLIFDNTRYVHGRDKVEGKRWLQRLYFRTSLDDLRRFTKSAFNCNRFRATDLLFSEA
jgi:hypothetical protein